MTGFDHALSEALQQSKYDRLTGRAFDLQGLIEEALTRFFEFVAGLFNLRLPNGVEINTDVVAIVFAVAGLLALLAITIAIVRRIKRKRLVSAYDLSDVYEEIKQRELTAREWLSVSQKCYGAGQNREAVRYRYIAALIALQEKKIITVRASQTNAQISGELASAAPALSAPFSEIADCFHLAWFGGRAVDSAAFAKFSETVRILVA